MNKKKYVQYKNDPNGTKWEVVSVHEDYYAVESRLPYGLLYFPTSDYILCTTPERWTDVTAVCRLTEGVWPTPDGTANAILVDSYIIWRASSHASGYRLRKVQLLKGCYDEHNFPDDPTVPQWAFIVEKRED